MSRELEQSDSDKRSRHIALVLAGIGVLVAGITPVIYYLLRDHVRPWNMTIIGAIGIFAAARLGFWWGVGFVGLSIGFKDLSIYLTRDWHPDPLSWLYFIAYVGIGWVFLRQNSSRTRIAASALTGSLVFFLVTNFTSWLELRTLYENSLSGLLDCYAAGVPFLKGTILGDLAFTGLLFATHAELSRVYSSKKQPIAINTSEKP